MNISPSPLNVTRYAAHLEETLKSKGLEITEGRDFKAFVAASKEIAARNGVSAPFDPRFVDIDPADMLWFEARQDGALIALQALRRETISTSLAKHLDQQYRRLYCDPDASECEIVNHAPGAFEITGNVVYHGGMYVVKTHRGAGLVKPFARLAVVLALLEWNPDYYWGFVDQVLMESGYSIKIGYLHGQPSGTHWANGSPGKIREHDWLVWSTNKDISYMCASGVRQMHKERAGPRSTSYTEEAGGCSGIP